MQQLCCLGGDRRMYYAVKALKEHGYICRTYRVPGFCDDLPSADEMKTIILPFPSFRNGSIPGLSPEDADGLPLFSPGNVLIGGNFPSDFVKKYSLDMQLYDVNASETFLMNNAELTAECALAKAILSFPGAMRGCRVLVLGFGRIGSHLVRLLLAYGADVSVFLRCRKDISFLRSLGVDAFSAPISEEQWGKYRCIFNTIPSQLIDRKTAGLFREDCLFFELASAPGALFPDAAEQLVDRYFPMPGLPGKYAPEQAGIYYAQAVLRRLEELSCTNR